MAEIDPALFERRLLRERKAREAAEHLLETKSRDLYAAQQELERRVEQLSRAREKAEALNAELKKNQARLLQAEKMASVGQLSAGIAHEINNPVGFVRSNLGTLKDYTDFLLGLVQLYEELESVEVDGRSELLSRIEEAKRTEDLDFVREDMVDLLSDSLEGVQRVAGIVQGLKSFARTDDSQQIALSDLHEGIEATLRIVWNELKYKCEIVKEYGEIPRVRCNLAQLNQVFMNLLVNAGQAIEEQGTITIRTTVDEDSVWVQVADNGKGIAPENLEQIFNPFFTTKSVGVGTGLGLSIAFGIVEDHGGELKVESTVGEGTTFSIRLPNVQEAPA